MRCERTESRDVDRGSPGPRTLCEGPTEPGAVIASCRIGGCPRVELRWDEKGSVIVVHELDATTTHCPPHLGPNDPGHSSRDPRPLDLNPRAQQDSHEPLPAPRRPSRPSCTASASIVSRGSLMPSSHSRIGSRRSSREYSEHRSWRRWSFLKKACGERKGIPRREVA